MGIEWVIERSNDQSRMSKSIMVHLISVESVSQFYEMVSHSSLANIKMSIYLTIKID